MIKAYKFRLYPTAEQKKVLIRTFGCVRFIYNRMLEDRQKYYAETKKTFNATPAQYKPRYPWLKEVDSLALANAQLQLYSAFKHFFRNPTMHYPRFRSKRTSKDEYITNNQKGSVRIVGDTIRLSKVGFVKFKAHQKLPENSTIKSATVTRDTAGRFYVAILVQYDIQVLKIVPKSFVAIAFSKNGIYMDSNGRRVDFPMEIKDMQKKLSMLQKAANRCKPDSNNQRKALKKLYSYQDKLRCSLMDFVHKISLQIARTYDCVFFETIDIRTTNKAFDSLSCKNFNIWERLYKYLSFNLEEMGKELILIKKETRPRQYCNKCRAYNVGVKNLNVTQWVCSKCGKSHDSDFNTALNLLNEGIKMISE